MKDVTFKILKIMINSNLTESELAKYTNTITTIDSLLQRKLIDNVKNVYTEPIGSYKITNTGREYVRQHVEDHHKFIVNFFSQFVSGFLVGVLTTVIAALILNWLTGII